MPKTLLLADYTSAAWQCKLKTALFVTAATPVRFCILLLPNTVAQGNAQNPVHADYTSAAWQVKLKTALFVTAATGWIGITPKTLCLLTTPVLLGKSS